MNKPGEDRELMLLEYLRGIYPGVEFSHIANSRQNERQPYDISCSYCLIDNVGLSEMRLIINHKEHMKHHIKTSKELGIPGFIAFEFLGYYYFLTVNNRTLRTKIRPMLDGYILRECERLPIPEDCKHLHKVRQVKIVDRDEDDDFYNKPVCYPHEWPQYKPKPIKKPFPTSFRTSIGFWH